MLSNVAAGTKAQIACLLEQRDTVGIVLNCLQNDEWDVRKEAAWVVSNIATGGTHEQVFALVKNHRVVAPLCSLLDVQDGKILMVALDALEALLKCDGKSSGLLQVPNLVDEADGLEQLEALQEHENHGVYTKAVHLIETFFGADESGDEGENLNPAATAEGFSFGLPAAPAAGGCVPAGFGGAMAPPPAPFGAAGGGAIVPLAPSGGFNFSANAFNAAV